MLINNEEKLVKLFIENAIWGNVKVKIDEYEPDKEEMSIGKQIGTLIRNYRDGEKIDPELISSLYRFFIIGRFTGYVEGELRDKEVEKELQELKNINEKMSQNLKDLTSTIIKFEGEKKKLFDENIMLANELEDRKNLIESYENSSIKKE